MNNNRKNWEKILFVFLLLFAAFAGRYAGVILFVLVFGLFMLVRNFLRTNWKQKLWFLLIATFVYFLIPFLIEYIGRGPSGCPHDPPLPPQRFPCAVVSASFFGLTPYFLFTDSSAENLLVGISILIWFLYAYIYVFICALTYRLFHRK